MPADRVLGPKTIGEPLLSSISIATSLDALVKGDTFVLSLLLPDVLRAFRPPLGLCQSTLDTLQIPPTTPVAGKSLMSVELPAPEQELRLPALLSFGSIYNSTLWNDTQKGGWNLSELCDTPLMVYGASRPLFQAMHKYSLEGIGSYQATFPPTVAFSEGLKMVSIELPHRRESHHSGAKDAKLLYRRFYEQERCTNSVLLHPIKLDEDFWPKVDRTHGFLPRTSRGKL